VSVLGEAVNRLLPSSDKPVNVWLVRNRPFLFIAEKSGGALTRVSNEGVTQNTEMQ
jgi:hypothetical protein